MRHRRQQVLLRLCVLALATATATLSVAAELEFEGTPSSKIQVTDGVAKVEPLAPLQAREFRVLIVRDGDAFLWASRNNLPLAKRESGAYITYVAANGAGYIRVLNPTMRRLRESLPPEQRDKDFLYMEHLVHQMGSITYFGK
jgi:hypothetical protein